MPAGPASASVLGTDMARSHAAALANIPETQLVACCDHSETARTSFLEHWQRLWPKVRTYGDCEEMLNSESIDMLIIAITDNVHEHPFVSAIQHNVPMVFCEKPLATSIESADRMIAAIRTSDSTCAVNITRRWYPTYNQVLAELDAGVIGELKHINLNFGGPRAMLWRNHTHMLDLLNLFARSHPVTVYAELEAGFEDYGTDYRGDGGRSPELEPGFEAMFTWENDVRGHLLGMKDTWPNLHVELVGTEGSITVNDQFASVTSPSERNTTTRQLAPRYTVAGIEAAIRDLKNSHAKGIDPACSVYEARKSVVMIDGILRSQAEGNRRVEIALPGR